MTDNLGIINILIVLLTTLCGGGVVGIVIQGMFSRNSDRANQAKSYSEVANSVNDMYIELRREIRELKEVVIELTDTIDELLPDMNLPSEQRARLRLANNKVKRIA